MTVATGTWRQVAGRVAAQADYGAGHRWLDVEVPAGFEAPEPGQFVQILLPAVSSSVLLPRPMSVAGVRRARGGTLTLGFLYAAVGNGTRALMALPVGAELEVLGPLGRGYPLDTPGTPVLVAGGRGVAPLLFAADALAQSGRRSELLFGARDRAHLVGLDDARRRLDSLGGRLHLCTDDGSRGLHGHVLQLLEKVAAKLDGPLAIHACGPHGMLKALAAWGVRRQVPTFLAMESVMACGTGVCRGCPLPRSAEGVAAYERAPRPSLYGNREWAMCCTEGPVFESGDLDWSRIE
jgi:dihydroorotate dehydrogenase electron transfer subunit